MHMAPYSSSMEVYFNGTSRPPRLRQDFSTSYGRASPGNYETKFKVAGSDSVLSALPSTSYDSLGFYTLVLFNNADAAWVP